MFDRREEAEPLVGVQDARLVEEGETAFRFQHALDDEHHVGASRRRNSSNTRAQACWYAQGRIPSRNSVTCCPSRSTMASFPTRSMRLMWLSRLMRDAWPVEPGRDLLDVRRLPGAVIALDQHPPVVGEACEDRQRRVPVEAVGVVDVRHVLGAFAETPARRARSRTRRSVAPRS